MKNKNYLTRTKLFSIIILCFIFLTLGAIAFCLGSKDIYAQVAEIEVHNNTSTSNPAYLSVHYTDGTMGMIIDETSDLNDSVFEQANYENIKKTAVKSSGLPDEQSIVAVFLGDGFTAAEQTDFLNRVTEISNYMITIEPFNYYKNYLTVYAVHSISNESGISGEAGGKFACLDSAGNPATDKCTPVDSSVFNCEHGRDTYYHSYYQWRSSANRVILEMASADRARARNDALAASSAVDMIQVIANSAMRGGTGQLPTVEQPLGVALTSINYGNSAGDWKDVVMHEFGHAYGGLWDEYWNGITPTEYPNMTQNSNSETVKWSQFVDFNNIGIYPFAASEWDGNPNQSTNPWYRPHQNCRMRQSRNPFCSVCIATLLEKMQQTTNVKLASFIIFDKAKGESGSNGVIAYKNEQMPQATAPTRKGYIFKGYYSDTNAKGLLWYDGNMNSMSPWKNDKDVTLYAYWEIDPTQTLYNVTLRGYSDFIDDYTDYKTIQVACGKEMPDFEMFAPKKDGYAFDGFYDSRDVKYYEMQVVDDRQTADMNMLEHAYIEKVFPVSGKTWDHTEDTTLTAYWVPLEGDYTYNNICDGKVISTSTAHIKTGRNTLTPASIEDYKFKYFTYNGQEFTSEIDLVLYRTYSNNIYPKDGIITAYYEDDKCLAAGSLITLADGSQVAVENLTGNEMLLVWNLYTGTYDTAPILFIDSDPLQLYKVINLTFSDGTTVKVISEHGFWDYDLNKYVYLDESADKYIGHWFNKGDGKVQLTGVEIKDEYTAAYSPVTYGHLCYYVNGMLSMPGGIDGLFNIFEVDPETMKYDEAAMQADIEQYGLFTYEEFASYFYLPEEAFNAFNGQYLKVAIGKGMVTVDRLVSLYNRYSEFLG